MNILEQDLCGCTGCGLCESICPKEAIKMKYDEEGFLYPTVYKDKCINCGKCVSNCVLKIPEMRKPCIAEYVGYSKDTREVISCSSGGIAATLYQTIIKNGGIVVGVVWNEDYCTCRYGWTDGKEIDVNEFKMSKYVQAEKENIYRKIFGLMGLYKLVLFVGLPCEVAAAKIYMQSHKLDKDVNTTIYYVDLVCWGPTSSKVLEGFLNKIGRHRVIKSLEMRYKHHGLERPYLRVMYQYGKTYLKPFYESDFGLVFTFFGRKSCANCRFQNEQSYADMSIGDYVIKNDDKAFENIRTESGVSRIIVRTAQGENLLKLINNDVHLVRTQGQTEKFYKDRMMRKNNEKREEFSGLLRKNGYKFSIYKSLGILRKRYHFLHSRISGYLKK